MRFILRVGTRSRRASGHQASGPDLRRHRRPDNQWKPSISSRLGRRLQELGVRNRKASRSRGITLQLLIEGDLGLRSRDQRGPMELPRWLVDSAKTASSSGIAPPSRNPASRRADHAENPRHCARAQYLMSAQIHPAQDWGPIGSVKAETENPRPGDSTRFRWPPARPRSRPSPVAARGPGHIGSVGAIT